MLTVRSRDATSIGYEVSGHGVPLVLVHGTASDHQRWSPLLATLEPRFRVYRVDRRGRGGSGDVSPYAIEREYEDLVVLIENIGEPVHLLGHSFGGLVALEAAARGARVRSLCVYEPPIAAGHLPVANELLEQMDQAVADDDRETAVTIFFRDVLQVAPEDLALLQALPSWLRRLRAAHTMARELRAAFDYALDSTQLRGLRMPTLLLLGSGSPESMAHATEMLAQSIPDSRIVILEGQAHNAMDTARELFLRTILRFLEST